MSSPKVGTPGRAMTGRINNTPRGGTPGLSRLGTPASRVPKTGHESRVRVVVRVRPSLDSEACDTSAITEIFKGSDGVDTLRLSDKNTSRVESYQLDACYSEQDSVSSIFSAEVEPILPSIFRGNNATVFAYGATGSGKTYTMEGSDDQPGLMTLAMESILAMANTTKSQIDISFYEVYMDRCYDLLNLTDMELPVLEDGHGRIQLRGLAQVEVNNIEDFDTIFGEGCAFRRTGLTGLNDVSSRSHSILTITVTNSNDGSPFAELSGKLNLIDLAGSENNRRTGNDGLRLLESTAINQSLFALSKVISALNANDSRVPYRDSKLTRILQDSLGGTSRAVMVACLNSDCYQESSATLSMASKSRQVVNRLQVEYQGDANDQKLDMEAKLKAWRESKNRTPRKPVTIYPSPLCAKTPSASKPAAPKRAVMSVPNAGNPKPRVNMVGKARKLQTGNECSFGTSFSKSGAEKDTGVSWTYVSDEGSANTGSNQEQQPNRVHLGASEANKDNCSPNTQSAGNTAIVAFASPPLSERLKNLSLSTLSAYKTPVNSTTSPPLSARLKNLSLSLRALAPLPVNMPRVAEMDVTPLKCKSSTVDYALGSLERNFAESNFNEIDHQSPLKLAACDPMTPALGENSMLTPVSCTGTPFDRFSRTNPELQRTLAKEYLDTLNTASREELLQLRGIGPVRTERILKLREKSPEPLREFDDLQKIGLSVRQANAIFNTNAVRQVIL